MIKPSQLPTSVIGRLLASSVSWQKAIYFRLGGQGREDVLTAEVFQALDLLPRTWFLGRTLRIGVHGAEETVRLLSNDVEALSFTLFPGDFYLVEESSAGHKPLWLQPDGLIESKSVFCMVEAKRIKHGSFQSEQLAREYLAVLKHAKAANKAPLLLLILPSGDSKDTDPPRSRMVRVGFKGASTRTMTVRDAIAGPLDDLLLRLEPEFAPAEELLAQIDSIVAYTTWDEIKSAASEGRALFRSGDASVNRSVRRMAEDLVAAIHWHGLHPDAGLDSGSQAARVPPICTTCTRYDLDDSRIVACDAFPNGIPDAITTNQTDHRRPVEGDQGMQWQQDPLLPRLDQDFYDRLLSRDAVESR